jgi:hypothetical protein
MLIKANKSSRRSNQRSINQKRLSKKRKPNRRKPNQRRRKMKLKIQLRFNKIKNHNKLSIHQRKKRN